MDVTTRDTNQSVRYRKSKYSCDRKETKGCQGLTGKFLGETVNAL